MCDTVEIINDEGTVLRLKKYKCRYYPTIFVGNVKDQLEAIRNMEIRDDDTFILSYPKSEKEMGLEEPGTHWVSNISNMLRTGKSTYLGSPYFLDFNEMETLNTLPSPRIIASHIPFNLMPRQVKEGKGKVIVIFRNPKDVAVSMYHFQKIVTKTSSIGAWNGYLKLFIEGNVHYGSWFDFLFGWEKTRKTYTGDNILYLMYEDIKQDLKKYIKVIASFLGQTRDQEFIDEIVNRCTFKNMGHAVFKEIEQIELNKKTNFPAFRKGEVGDWKNYFTVSQSEYFDQVYKEKMVQSTMNFKFE